MPLINVTLRALLSYAAGMAWIGLAVLSARALAPQYATAAGWLAALAALILAMFALLQQKRLHANVVRLLSLRIWQRPGVCLLIALVLGLLARVAWDLTYPAQPSSDGATYVGLAKALSEGSPYVSGGTRAYWPPGYPIFLVPWVLLFDQIGTAILISNLFLYAIGVLGVWALAKELCGARAAAMSAMLYALWPNLVFQAGLPEKEQVLVALLPWVLRFVILAARTERTGMAMLHALLAGALIGACNLVQPALLLFPAIILLAWLLATRHLRRSVLLLLALSVGIAAVILPWSLRNQKVLGHFVLVSTNGGIGLYGANNPRASGGYFEHWAESDLLQLSELEADREGKRRFVEWVRTHPDDFARLAIEKNLRFMGDDAVGAFQTFRRGQVGSSNSTYAVFKGLSNLYWLAFWTAALLLLAASMRGRAQWSPLEALVPATFIYSFALHSIAESAGKYHVLMTGVLCVLLALLMEDAAKAQSSRTLSPSADGPFLPSR